MGALLFHPEHYHVADALIKADKVFDFLSIPGAGHGSIGDYEERKRRDYFVRHLLETEPPSWNEISASESGNGYVSQ